MNKNFIKVPTVFTTSALEEEKCQAILQKKEFCVNYQDICFLNPYHDINRRYMDMMQPRGICYVDVFHIGYLVAQNYVIVKTEDTDNIFIIILIDMEKPAAGINA